MKLRYCDLKSVFLSTESGPGLTLTSPDRRIRVEVQGARSIANMKEMRECVKYVVLEYGASF